MRYSYRHYLRSEHWQNLRLAKLAQTNAVCHFCRTTSVSNDVHHVIYRQSLRETKMRDLRVLCRRCHDLVHQVLKRFPAIKREEHGRAQWRITEQHVKILLGQKYAKPSEEKLVSQPEMAMASSRLKLARRNVHVSRFVAPLTEHLAHWFRHHPDCTDQEIVERAGRHAGKEALIALKEAGSA